VAQRFSGCPVPNEEEQRNWPARTLGLHFISKASSYRW